MSHPTGQTPQVGLVLFAGPGGSSPVEAMLEGASCAALLDLLEAARACQLFHPLILVTELPQLRAAVGPQVHLEEGGADFHFGRRLLEIVQKHDLPAVAVAGAGSAPLLLAEELAAFAWRLAEAPGTVVANNLYSADILSFSPARALEKVTLPERDNSLALALWREAGLQPMELPRTPGTQFDIDTPTDLVILSLHERTAPRLRAFLEGLKLDTALAQRLGRVLTDPTATVVVAGRVGSHAWAYLERETASRVRLFAEERGMESEGRAARGEARSLLGFYLQEVGLERFFATLAQLGHGAVLDTRVLMAHLGLHPSQQDRFLSDLGQADQIQDPFLREFTRQAQSASIPVLLGGHSLVSGGLMALTEAAWLAVDREREASVE